MFSPRLIKLTAINLGLVLFLVSLAISDSIAQEWIETKKGCKVWNPNPLPNEAIKWTGDCVDGFASGTGKLTWFRDGKVGDVYSGEMQNGKLHGQGENTYANGGSFKGSFKDGKKHGIGTEYYDWGGKFIHRYENGKIAEVPVHSMGLMLPNWADNVKIYSDNENFNNDTYHGVLIPGTQMKLMDNRVYVMNKKVAKNLYETKALANVINVMTVPDSKKGIPSVTGFVLLSQTPFQELYNQQRGLIVAGCIQGNCKDGSGTFIGKAGGKYKGKFKDGKFNGQGSIYYQGGTTYVGGWKDGKFHGKGTKTFANKGETYEGDYKEGKEHGYGKYTWKSGNMYEGQFVNGNAIGEGYRTYSDGSRYKGHFKNYKPDGKGTMFYKNGNTEEGLWKDGKYFGPMPDRDKDNVPDDEDDCPDLYGTVANKGCPEVSAVKEIAGDFYRGSGDPLKGLNVSKAQKMVIGNYYALIIGIDKYSGQWTPLNNAVRDARAIEAILRSKYKADHFQVLYDQQATRENIINEFVKLIERVKENDNVIIYYSGHGEFQKALNRGYWVPVDAHIASISKYISNADIQTFLGGIKSKHTLLISDACFSGDIFRGKTYSVPFDDSEKYFQTVHNLKSCQAITSGGIEPVMDGGSDGHSVFAYYILKGLRENENKFFDASQLFANIIIPVTNNSNQSPKFQPIKDTGDEGGQFIFIKK